MSSAAFVSGLRAQPGTIDLAGAATPAWSLRVQLLDAWDAVQVRAAPATPLRAVLRPALERLAGPDARLEHHDCKLRGVRLDDLDRPIAEHGVLDGSILLLVHAARQPVR